MEEKTRDNSRKTSDDMHGYVCMHVGDDTPGFAVINPTAVMRGIRCKKAI